MVAEAIRSLFKSQFSSPWSFSFHHQVVAHLVQEFSPVLKDSNIKTHESFVNGEKDS